MRIRTIKPSFWSDQRIRRLTIPARLLFIATWNLADDNGRLIWDVDYLRAHVFMSDHGLDVAALMAELVTAGRVVTYLADGDEYAEIVNFTAHQRINRPNLERVCPAPACAVRDDSLNDHGNVSDTSLLEGKGREGKGQTARPANDAAELSTGSSSSVIYERVLDELTLRATTGKRGVRNPAAYAQGVRAKIRTEKDDAIRLCIVSGWTWEQIVDHLAAPSSTPGEQGARLHVVKPTDPALLATPDEELAEPKSPAAKRAAARAKTVAT